MQFLKMEIVDYPDPDPDPDWDREDYQDDIEHIEKTTGMMYLPEYVDGDFMLAVQEKIHEIWV